MAMAATAGMGATADTAVTPAMEATAGTTAALVAMGLTLRRRMLRRRMRSPRCRRRGTGGCRCPAWRRHRGRRRRQCRRRARPRWTMAASTWEV
eukprot:1076030-Prymnesium_polylepis.1